MALVAMIVTALFLGIRAILLLALHGEEPEVRRPKRRRSSSSRSYRRHLRLRRRATRLAEVKVKLPSLRPEFGFRRQWRRSPQFRGLVTAHNHVKEMLQDVEASLAEAERAEKALLSKAGKKEAGLKREALGWVSSKRAERRRRNRRNRSAHRLALRQAMSLGARDMFLGFEKSIPPKVVRPSGRKVEKVMPREHSRAWFIQGWRRVNHLKVMARHHAIPSQEELRGEDEVLPVYLVRRAEEKTLSKLGEGYWEDKGSFFRSPGTVQEIHPRERVFSGGILRDVVEAKEVA